MKDYDGQHRKRIKKYTRAIETAYKELIATASSLAVKTKLKDELFQFKKNPKIAKQFDKALQSYYNAIKSNLKIGTSNEWDFANQKYDELRLAMLSRVSSKVTEDIIVKEILAVAKSPRNIEALQAFQNRKIGDFTISERVWNITQQTKKELEFAIDVSLAEGKSAQDLAKEIKHNLKHPDKLFRKVRDKRGNLVISKNAKLFNPGQGVYRSSHKNALRLASNEINIAYRSSEQNRISGNNDVVGIEIALSNSHKIYDICDLLKGSYPKDFVWSGWHISCLCHRKTILKSDEEFINELNNDQNLPPDSSKNYVKDTPKAFETWIVENEEKMQGWKNKPNFIADNKKYYEPIQRKAIS